MNTVEYLTHTTASKICDQLKQKIGNDIKYVKFLHVNRQGEKIKGGSSLGLAQN